jgi:hypothetical protein
VITDMLDNQGYNVKINENIPFDEYLKKGKNSL